MGDILWLSLENITYHIKFSEHCYISTIYALAIFIQQIFVEHLTATVTVLGPGDKQRLCSLANKKKAVGENPL